MKMMPKWIAEYRVSSSQKRPSTAVSSFILGQTSKIKFLAGISEASRFFAPGQAAAHTKGEADEAIQELESGFLVV